MTDFVQIGQVYCQITFHVFGFSVLTIIEFLEFLLDGLVIGFMKISGKSENMKSQINVVEKPPLDGTNVVNAGVINPETVTKRKCPDNIMARNVKRIGNKVYRTNPIKAYKLNGKTGWKSLKTRKVTPKYDPRFDQNPDIADPSNAYYQRGRINRDLGKYDGGALTPTDVDPRIPAKHN